MDKKSRETPNDGKANTHSLTLSFIVNLIIPSIIVSSLSRPNVIPPNHRRHPPAPSVLAASETYLEGTSGDVCPMEGLLALFGGFGRPELGVAEVLARKRVDVDQLAETTKRVLRAARKRCNA